MPDESVTELLMDGCDAIRPYVCALDLTGEFQGEQTPVRHRGACALQLPLAEALESGHRQVEQEYRREAACAATDLPRVEALPVRYGGVRGWEQTFLASGCRGAVRFECLASALRARAVSCRSLPAATRDELQGAALAAARRLAPGCEPSSSDVGRLDKPMSQVRIALRCSSGPERPPEPSELPLLCHRAWRTEGGPGSPVRCRR